MDKQMNRFKRTVKNIGLPEGARLNETESPPLKVGLDGKSRKIWAFKLRKTGKCKIACENPKPFLAHYLFTGTLKR